MQPLYPDRQPVSLKPLPDNPVVSILVPSYNQGQFIKDTLDSILAQDYRPLRIFVVDGASTDETIDVLKSYGDIPELNWVSEPDKGVVDAVNKGFDRLEGDICGIQSSDDVYLPGAVRRIVEEFQASAETGLIYGDTVKVDADGAEILRYQIGPWSLENVFLLKTWIPQPSAFFRMEMLQACGGWDDRIPYAPDTDLWIRMAFRTDVKKIDHYLSQRRMHDAQRDTQGEKIIRSYCQMIDQSPDIAASSPEIRRAAEAGKYLMKIRYNPSGSDWANARNRFRAGQIAPEIRNLSGVLHDLALPMRRKLSTVKQQVTNSPTDTTNSRTGAIQIWKEHAAVLLKDSARYRRGLSAKMRAANGDPLWVHLCNRNETLTVNPDGPGVQCDWRWTSDLHACKVIPRYARQLATRAFLDWPIQFRDENNTPGQPRVSFIIAHEGNERTDHLIWVTRSILSQNQIPVECLVIDQSQNDSVAARIPNGVKYFHRPRPADLDGWRKSWAFNQGAREAAGDILVFHDGDIVCPADYAAAITEQMKESGAVSIQRFLFNMSQTDTESLFASGSWPVRLQPDRIRQNWEGGTIAVRKKAFFEIGGYDEAFVGWGGEDNEFFDRCRAIQHLRFGFVPFIHLWHPAQTDKHTTDNRNITHVLDERIQMPVELRIKELTQRDFGNATTPSPRLGYRDAAMQPRVNS